MKLIGEGRDEFPTHFPTREIFCFKCGVSSGEYRLDRFHRFIIPHYYDCYGGHGVIRNCFGWK